MHKLDDIQIPRIPVFLQQLHADSQWAIGYSDGDVEFRNRNMEAGVVEDSPGKSSTLTRIGFTFDKLEPCTNCTVLGNLSMLIKSSIGLSMALSPHATAKATFGKDHICNISHLHLPIELVVDDSKSKSSCAMSNF